MCDFLSYIRILTRQEGFLIAHLRPKVVGADAPYGIFCEAQVVGLATLQAIKRLAQHLLRHLDPLSEGGRSAFVGVTEGQGEPAVFASDDGQRCDLDDSDTPTRALPGTQSVNLVRPFFAPLS